MLRPSGIGSNSSKSGWISKAGGTQLFGKIIANTVESLAEPKSWYSLVGACLLTHRFYGVLQITKYPSATRGFYLEAAKSILFMISIAEISSTGSNFRKLIQVLFCVIIGSSLMAHPMLAATFGLFTYTDNGSNIKITDYPNDATGAVTIPSMISGKPVTGIATYTFFGCADVTGVSIPASVATIGEFAFGSCISLTSITVSPDNASFSSANGVLFNKSKSTLLQFPTGKSGHFRIPGGVTSVADNAFFRSPNLTSLEIPSSVGTIGIQSFYACESLADVTFAEGITGIGRYAFGACHSLLDLNLPQSLTFIDSAAFSDCEGLTKVTIPSGVTTIGAGAFTYCSGLKKIIVDGANPNYSSIGGILFDKQQTTIVIYPGGRTGYFTIPSRVTAIASFAFANCTQILDMTIPANVAAIDSYAFFGCTNLTVATFLGNAPYMGTQVFDFTATGFGIRFVSGNTGFTTPTWRSYPCASATAEPEIEVLQPLGTSLVDNSVTKSFGRTKVGNTSTSKTFTIRNTGTSQLTDLSVAIGGHNAANFISTEPARSTLVPGAFTTFKVRFKPNATGIRNAVLRIASNDTNENPFDIQIKGTGTTP